MDANQDQGVPGSIDEQHNWRYTLRQFANPRVWSMLFLGFSAGLPLLLIFSSLSLWLNEAGVERATITFFSWGALAYSFKFVWAPLVDRLPVPILTRSMGRRRSWLLLSQSSIALAICSMAMIDPALGEQHLTWMALAVVLLGFSSATQDIVIDAFRIESGTPDLQALMSSTYIAGYRLGMIVTGAGALLLASWFGTTKAAYIYNAWQNTYFIMAGFMGIGILTTFLVPEPQRNELRDEYSPWQYFRFFLLFILAVLVLVASYLLSDELTAHSKDWLANQLGNKAIAGLFVESVRLSLAVSLAAIAAMLLYRLGVADRKLVVDSYVEPIREFFTRHGKNLAILLLVFICFYRISDIVLGVISNVFYQDMGYTKDEIATAVKFFGVVMTIVGGLVGGVFALRFGVIRVLFLGALLTIVTNLLFMWLANIEHNLAILYFVVSADNLAAGIASAAFVAFLSSLTNISFTAMQYAIFSSLMTLFPKGIGGYSGSIVENVGYSNFFLIASLMGVPILFLILLVKKYLVLEKTGDK